MEQAEGALISSFEILPLNQQNGHHITEIVTSLNLIPQMRAKQDFPAGISNSKGLIQQWLTNEANTEDS